MSGPYPGIVLRISGGIPHTPAGGGSMEPPMSSLPSDRMSTNALRLSDSGLARRCSRAYLNGSFCEFTRMVDLTYIETREHTACGACDFTSLSSGMVTSVGKVMSNLPATKARIAVDRLGMMVNSMPSRYGRSFFQ